MSGWDEEQRLGALRRQQVLDTPPEERFDEIVRAAAEMFRAPMAAVSLVDERRQWFKARVGLEVAETARDLSFCALAMRRDGVMIVPDATCDPLFADNALVTGDPGIRFYAGAAIRSEDGLPLGALCILDTVARPEGMPPDQAQMLQMLADQVSEQLRLRRLLQRQIERAAQQSDTMRATRGREDRLLRALQSGEVGWWEWDVTDDIVTGNTELARDLGIDAQLLADGVPLEVLFVNVHPLDRDDLMRALRDAVATGERLREEFRLLHPGGRVLWVSARGQCLRDPSGRPSCFPGIVIDVTERREAEQRLREADLGRELAMSAARLGSWDHDMALGIRRYDARALAMMGLTEAESADVANSYAVIHPDDRARVERAARAATEATRIGPFRETFRVIDRGTGEIRWLSAVGRTEFRNGVCTRFIGVLADVTEEKSAEEHRKLLSGELTHRVKNTLAVVASIVDASIRGAPDLAAARSDVAQRLASLGKAHDLLTQRSWLSADVPTVVDGAVTALSLPMNRLEISGPSILLGPRPALQLALALHELGTNAVKYGALAGEQGSIRIAWRTVAGATGHRFQFDWDERGGPAVTPPTRRGFGTRLIEAITAAEFRGTSRLSYPREGLRWTLDAPLGANLPATLDDAPAAPRGH